MFRWKAKIYDWGWRGGDKGKAPLLLRKSKFMQNFYLQRHVDSSQTQHQLTLSRDCHKCLKPSQTSKTLFQVSTLRGIRKLNSLSRLFVLSRLSRLFRSHFLSRLSRLSRLFHERVPALRNYKLSEQSFFRNFNDVMRNYFETSIIFEVYRKNSKKLPP